jgi:hypothetical protein
MEKFPNELIEVISIKFIHYHVAKLFPTTLPDINFDSLHPNSVGPVKLTVANLTQF